ncbi:hypothetical protein BDQ17DRAFT_1348543 [Cyathus striatus]|nr:hypothetical protein BDQ17DRAFT_1348543 [Cyathus striatus]
MANSGQDSLRHDKTSYIGAMPPEIMEEIFAFCMTWSFERKRIPNCMGWAQVCQIWYQHSISSARLWHSVDLTNVKFAQCALQRSRESPISIISSRPSYFLPATISMQGYRVQSIDVYLFPDDMETLFSSLGPCPHLASLTLKTPVASSFIPHINIDCSSIRHLHLTSVSVPWETCTNLMSLSLQRLGKETAPSAESLEGIISRSPELSRVHLVDVQLSVPTRHGLMDYDDQECVVGMRIATNAAAVKAMLRTLSWHHHSLPNDPISSVSNNRAYQVVKLRIDHHHAAFFEEDSQPWSNNAESIILSVTITALSTPSLALLLDTPHLSVLEVGKGMLGQITTDDLRTLLANVPKLESLRIGPKNDLSELLDLLTADSSQILCPLLSSISFGCQGDYWRNFSKECLNKVIACSRSRFLMGYPLKNAAFIKCEGITSQSVEALSAFVDKLDITGLGSRKKSHAYVYSGFEF